MQTKLFYDVYSYITVLRQKGVKMKDIANEVNLSSSVLSALYSTVLPVFMKSAEQMPPEEALNYAISQVNNISKKRLLSCIEEVCFSLKNFNPKKIFEADAFIGSLYKFANKTENIVHSYLGTYISYSLSSAKDALKKEPFMLSNGENGHIKVVRRSAYNSLNSGMAIVANGHSMYIMLNEMDETQLALVSIYLQLPFYENIRFLRGIYMTLDYNRNPIARRIVFVKKSDQYDIDSFDTYKGEIILKENFTPEEQVYYQYTCQSSDYVRMCSIPSPKLNEEDLITEKHLLNTIFKE